MSQDSVAQLRRWLVEQELDAFLVTQPHNRSYLSGWLNEDTEGAGLLLIGAQQQILMTNPLYAEAAGREAEGWEIFVPPPREYAPAVAERARQYGWSKIGFESAAMAVADYEKYRTAGDGVFTLIPFEESFVSSLRLVKRPDELAALRKAIAITDETFAYICNWLQPGMTEKEVQFEISRKMVDLGADGPAFESIVAAGPNGSMPHAHASQRPIQAGELITFDMGARYKGYCADMTRTICLGQPSDPRMVEIYNAVLQAMKNCEAGLRGGISGKAGDALARDTLQAAGLVEYFVHSTGHGVGLQVHENPALSPRAPEDMLMPAGCVVTVEPGVYIPEWGGVRIEDCVLLREDGAEVLTQSPVTLVIER